MTVCAIECVRAACPDPSWLEKHETFVLTMVATVSATVTAILSYFLKSRCTKIKCFGLSCVRQPIPADPENVTCNVTTSDPENI